MGDWHPAKDCHIRCQWHKPCHRLGGRFGAHRQRRLGVGHTYAKAGQYRVIVDGSVDGLYHVGGSGTPELLRYVDQWGDIEWSSMQDMFHGASNMEYRATDTPDLSSVTTMESMFNQATSFNGDISNWNVSKVADMSYMFLSASSFNQSLNSWDVSAVTDTSSMFFTASVFNGDISNWNVSESDRHELHVLHRLRLQRRHL